MRLSDVLNGMSNVAEMIASTRSREARPQMCIRDRVRSELKRVTWPTRNEVLRWTGVVVGALLFFGIFVAVLDNLIVTPIVVGISSIGAGV